ncbi:glycoside hydrolase family 43 protein [Stemphylium lycopersici]|nr:glycoside hydrolase family 43 protein [Stemphylium lycopersici]
MVQSYTTWYKYNNTLTNRPNPQFHPDPSCIFHQPDETFYCASSSFNVFPGIPIHASKDLVSWRLVGHALNRATQLPVLAESVGSTSGIWAPALRFHNGTFFLLTTMVHDKRADNDSSRWGNIIFSTTDLWDESKWSDAVHLDFEGYDISPHWDGDGNAYGIHINRVDLATGELLGNWTNLWNGTGGIAPEGPHIFKKDNWYYLMIAEGGTGLLHMETMARSRNLYGPYEENPSNPILSNANTTEYFQAVGHADLFQDNQGKWWGVALAVRSGPEWTTFPMGRETVLYNVTWERDSWPVLQNPVQGEMRGWELPSLNGYQEAPGKGSNSTDNGHLVPHFHFHAISYIPVPADVLVPVPEAWRGEDITLALRAVNVTHYAFSAGLAGGSGGVRDIAVVGGDVISWGFTGALVGATTHIPHLPNNAVHLMPSDTDHALHKPMQHIISSRLLATRLPVQQSEHKRVVVAPPFSLSLSHKRGADTGDTEARPAKAMGASIEAVPKPKPSLMCL